MVERVERHHERVTVTRNGREAAVLISPDDLAALEETIDVLSDPQALADIRDADAAYARGDVGSRRRLGTQPAPCHLSSRTSWCWHSQRFGLSPPTCRKPSQPRLSSS